MIDLYLKAQSEAAMKAALPWMVNSDGEWITANHQWAFDPVGLIVQTHATLDAAGNVVANAVFHPGWHANLRLLDEASARLHEGKDYCLGAREVNADGSPGPVLFGDPPSNPARVWS
ncbi:MAG: hypothetical protein ACM31D_04570 [Bacteroidota bacterium]